MDPATLRDDMVEGLAHETKGVLDSERVGLAMLAVPRHEFVPERVAYEDRAHEVDGTTALAPSLVATLLQALDPREGDETLVVGAGVGYTAAVCAEIVGAERVHAVDISRPMVYRARENLAEAGYGAVLVDHRDGTRGLPEYAPFDRILVEAAAVRPPEALRSQLSPDGRLVMPRGTPGEQSLVAVSAEGETERFGPVRFKPLLLDGEQTGAPERNRMHREDREFAERSAHRRHGWEQEWIDWDRY